MKMVPPTLIVLSDLSVAALFNADALKTNDSCNYIRTAHEFCVKVRNVHRLFRNVTLRYAIEHDQCIRHAKMNTQHIFKLRCDIFVIYDATTQIYDLTTVAFM